MQQQSAQTWARSAVIAIHHTIWCFAEHLRNQLALSGTGSDERLQNSRSCRR
jgi:hypothetical protein